MKDNRGFSLVELLVAMAIATIVAGSVAYFLVNSMRIYSSEMNDLTMQQEVSTAFNIIEGYIKEAQFIAIGNYAEDSSDEVGSALTPNKTKYLVLGTFEKKVQAKNKQNVNYKFSGVLIVSDRAVRQDEYADGDTPVQGCLYLKTYKDEVVDSTAGNNGKYNLSKPDKIKAEVNDILKPENKNKYLLATNVQNFCIIPESMAPGGTLITPGQCNSETAINNGYKIWVDNGEPSNLQYYYDNNISLKVNITVARQLAGKTEKKTITESVMIRNYLSEDIIINDVANKYKKFNNRKYQ